MVTKNYPVNHQVQIQLACQSLFHRGEWLKNKRFRLSMIHVRFAIAMKTTVVFALCHRIERQNHIQCPEARHLLQILTYSAPGTWNLRIVHIVMVVGLAETPRHKRWVIRFVVVLSSRGGETVNVVVALRNVRPET